MRITISVKLKQSVSQLEKVGTDTFVARVTAAPENNKANLEAQSLVAKHYEVPKSVIKLIRGAKSKI